MRVKVTNFQCFDELDIELEGFTVITGATNNGKSAFIRTLRTGLFNEWHPSYLRREGISREIIDAEVTKKSGAKKPKKKTCTVELSGFSLKHPSNTQGITSLTLTKSDKKNNYDLNLIDYTKINPNEIESGVEIPLRTLSFPKTGKESPQELQECGFSYFETDKQKYNLNFQTQFEPLFLMSDSYATFTSFFNKLFGVDRYERCLHSVNLDLTRTKKAYNKVKEEELRLRSLAEVFEKYQAQAETYFGQAQEIVDELEKTSEDVDGAQSTKDQIQSGQDSLEEALLVLRKFKAATKPSETLASVRDSITEHLDFLQSFHTELKELRQYRSAMDVVSHNYRQATKEMKSLIGKQVASQAYLKELSEHAQQRQEILLAESVVEALKSHTEKYREAKGQMSELLRVSKALKRLLPILRQRYQETADFEKKVQEAKSMVSEAKGVFENAKKARSTIEYIESMKPRFRQALKEVQGVIEEHSKHSVQCPKCSHEFVPSST